MHDDYVSTEHILLALTDDRSVSGILERNGVTHDAILQALTAIRGGQRITSQDPESTYKSLEKYGRDLTALARQGKLDPVIGREDEIRRVMQVHQPPHQEQPGADRRGGRRQDGDRRGAGAAHRQRRRAGRPARQAVDRAGYGRAGGRARSFAASSRNG